MRRSEVEAALAERGGDLAAFRAWPTVVLFGSRAAGCAEANSDWDLLLVGPPSFTRSIPSFDLVHVVGSRRWWESTELAIHVRAYGVWLSGERPHDWHIDFKPAIAQKARVINVRATALRNSWRSISPLRREREVVVLRRDLQRLVLLQRGEAVPPRQFLDQAWLRTPEIAAFSSLDGIAISPAEFDTWLRAPE